MYGPRDRQAIELAGSNRFPRLYRRGPAAGLASPEVGETVLLVTSLGVTLTKNMQAVHIWLFPPPRETVTIEDVATANIQEQELEGLPDC